jgi:hypothetical protein
VLSKYGQLQKASFSSALFPKLELLAMLASIATAFVSANSTDVKLQPVEHKRCPYARINDSNEGRSNSFVYGWRCERDAAFECAFNTRRRGSVVSKLSSMS